ncbi:MAG: hypothetical protein R2880_08500 [Deinococcales bacterium]
MRWFYRWCLAFLALTLLSIVLASSYLELSLEDIFEKADMAFEAKVLTSTVELIDDKPWTKVEFSVVSVFKGELGKETSLSFYGGNHDSISLQVTGMPRFMEGEDLLIFAYKDRYYSPLVGFSQGLFRSRVGGWQNEAGKYLQADEAKNLSLGDSVVDSKLVLEALRDFYARRAE